MSFSYIRRREGSEHWELMSVRGCAAIKCGCKHFRIRERNFSFKQSSQILKVVHQCVVGARFVLDVLQMNLIVTRSER